MCLNSGARAETQLTQGEPRTQYPAQQASCTTHTGQMHLPGAESGAQAWKAGRPVCCRYTTGKSCPGSATDGIFSALRVLSPGYMPGLGSEEDWGREGDNGGELSSVSETMFSFVERVLSEIVIYIRRLELSAYLVRISYTWAIPSLRPSACEAGTEATKP